MKNSRLILLFAAGLLVMGTISRGEIFGTADDLAQARVYAATNRAFDCVMAVGGLQSRGWWSFGSSVLIAPRWVLLAGHQVMPNDYLGSYDALSVNAKVPGTNTLLARWYIAAAFVHPDYSSSSGSGVDLTLGYLAEAVTNISPAVRCRVNPHLPTVMTMVGFGCPGVVDQSVPNYDGVKRGGFGRVAPNPALFWVGSQYFLCEFSDPARNSVPPLQWKISNFDSGCPWGIVTNGQFEIAGIASFTYPGGPIAHYGYGSGAVNITLYNDWIDSVIASVEPKLTVVPVESGNIRVQWPSVATTFTLQTSCDCSGNNWVPTEAQVQSDGTNTWIIVSRDGPMRFFRLMAASPFRQPGVFLQTIPRSTVKTSRSLPLIRKSNVKSLGAFPEMRRVSVDY